jgi:hypothetical protein
MQKDQAACTTGTTTYWLECPNTTHIVCFSSNNKIPKNQIPSQKNTPKPCIAAAGGGSCSTSYTINQHLNLPSPTRISPLLLFASSITHTQYMATILFFSLLLLLLQNATTLIQNHLHDLLSKLSSNPKSPPQKKYTHNNNNNNYNSSSSSSRSSSSASRSSRFDHLNLDNKTSIKP